MIRPKRLLSADLGREVVLIVLIIREECVMSVSWLIPVGNSTASAFCNKGVDVFKQKVSLEMD